MGDAIIDGTKPGGAKKGAEKIWSRRLRNGIRHEPVAKSVSEEKLVGGYDTADPIRLQGLPVDDFLHARANKIAEPDISCDGRVRLPQEQHIDCALDRPIEKHLISGRVNCEAVGAYAVGAAWVGEEQGLEESTIKWWTCERDHNRRRKQPHTLNRSARIENAVRG